MFIRDSTTSLSLVYTTYPIAALQMPAVVGRCLKLLGPHAAVASELPNIRCREGAQPTDEVRTVALWLRNRTVISGVAIRRAERRAG